MNVYLFGAGKYGLRYLELYGSAEITGFIDNVKRKSSTGWNNHPVFTYDEYNI